VLNLAKKYHQYNTYVLGIGNDVNREFLKKLGSNGMTEFTAAGSYFAKHFVSDTLIQVRVSKPQ
jgi:hypothetical protein